MRRKQVVAPSRAATFAARGRSALEAEVHCLVSAQALDEGNGAVFDALIESWAGQESAVMRAAARAELAALQSRSALLGQEVARIDDRLAAEAAHAESVKSDLAQARVTLRGRS